MEGHFQTVRTSPSFPVGIGTLSPYLIVQEAEVLLDFLKTVFGGVEVYRSHRPDGKIANVQIQFSECILMISEANIDFPSLRTSFYLYVKNVDEAYKKALENGGQTSMLPCDMPYGDRNAGIIDPVGNIWWIAHRLG